MFTEQGHKMGRLNDKLDNIETKARKANNKM
jgi:hypothetical protein